MTRSDFLKLALGAAALPSTVVGRAPSPCTIVDSAPSPCTAVGRAPSPCTAVGSAPSPCTAVGRAPSPCIARAKAEVQLQLDYHLIGGCVFCSTEHPDPIAMGTRQKQPRHSSLH